MDKLLLVLLLQLLIVLQILLVLLICPDATGQKSRVQRDYWALGRGCRSGRLSTNCRDPERLRNILLEDCVE